MRHVASYRMEGFGRSVIGSIFFIVSIVFARGKHREKQGYVQDDFAYFRSDYFILCMVVILQTTFSIAFSVMKMLFSFKFHWHLSLRWRHNDHAGVSNHQPHDCLLNRLFRRRSKKTSKLRVTGLCAGNSPGPVNSPHKGPVTRKVLPFDDVIMIPTGPTINRPPFVQICPH